MSQGTEQTDLSAFATTNNPSEWERRIEELESNFDWMEEVLKTTSENVTDLLENVEQLADVRDGYQPQPETDRTEITYQ